MRYLLLITVLSCTAHAYDWADYKREHPSSPQQEADNAQAGVTRAQAEEARHEAENQAIIDAVSAPRPQPAQTKGQTCVTKPRRNVYNQTEWVTECQ